ncbi:hypothetical protein SSX86_028131 [Deinandra increscens subsp. villosa]|uniref:BACK domain-containing protein n=1 Tax=Deinandra increscens subsp. villosa TaxID=3103831 RepID=A0AAP0CDV3_9ASTR
MKKMAAAIVALVLRSMIAISPIVFFASIYLLWSRSGLHSHHQLFSNGMRESKQCYVNLQINASEEAAFMELLKFMHSNTLTVTTAQAVLDILMAADKFNVASCIREFQDEGLISNDDLQVGSEDEVYVAQEIEEAALMELLKFMHTNTLTVTTAPGVIDVLMAANKFDVVSCIRQCGRLLRNLTMTPECVLAYLDLPSTILMSPSFRPLTVAAKQFYAVHFKDITKLFEDEILGLSLYSSVMKIISSDDLQVDTEDALVEFALKWARAQDPDIVYRRALIAAWP